MVAQNFKKKLILISKNQNQTKLCSIQKQISYILKLWFYFHGSKQINLYVTSFIHDPYVELKYSRCFTITLQVSKKSLKIVQKIWIVPYCATQVNCFHPPISENQNAYWAIQKQYSILNPIFNILGFKLGSKSSFLAIWMTF